MVLASQTPRQTHRWRYMTNERRRRRGLGPLLLVIVAAAVGAGVWAWTRSGDDGAREQSALEAAEGGDRTSEAVGPDELAFRGQAQPHSQPKAEPNTQFQPEPELRAPSDPASDAKPGLQPASPSRSTAPARPSGPVAEPPARSSAPSDPPSVPPSAVDEPPRELTIGNARDAGAGRREAAGPGGRPGDRQSGRQPDRQPERAAPSGPDARSMDGPARVRLVRERDLPLAEMRAVLFSPAIVPSDPYSRVYQIKPGDTLERIAQREGLDADWRLLKRINRIADEKRIQPGQKIKLIPGAFHAVVIKSEFRMDVYLGDSSDRLLVACLPVGLGEHDSTPTGRFKVRPRSKLVNPAWTNPRTGEHFKASDPGNPIGEHWIGLQGIDEHNRDIEGYGIHGTIEPESLGRQASMGCIRMAAPDVELVYELLTEPNSTVEIVN